MLLAYENHASQVLRRRYLYCVDSIANVSKRTLEIALACSVDTTGTSLSVLLKLVRMKLKSLESRFVPRSIHGHMRVVAMTWCEERVAVAWDGDVGNARGNVYHGTVIGVGKYGDVLRVEFDEKVGNTNRGGARKVQSIPVIHVRRL